MSRNKQPKGVPVDSNGEAAYDPTANVIALVLAEKTRGDDLRAASDLLCEERHDHVEEISRLRAEHAAVEKRAESDRLDAIRQVDQTNVTSKAEQTLAAVQALAATNKTEAETLRALVTSTAVTIAAQSESRFNGVDARIAALEKTSYTAGGRGGGMQQFWGYIVAGIMLAIALYSTFRPH